MASSKKNAPAQKTATPALLPLKRLEATHAATIIDQVNQSLAKTGFAAKVDEIHFVPSGAAQHNCDDCPPPSVCKRVCFINVDGDPECEDRCVGPDEA
ncbi:MAG: hypothetical protein ABJC09_17225 [Terriglobia bacterium]